MLAVTIVVITIKGAMEVVTQKGEDEDPTIS